MHELTTSGYKQNSLHFLWAVSPEGLTGSPKREHMAYKEQLKSIALVSKTYLQRSLPKICLESLFRAEDNGKNVMNTGLKCRSKSRVSNKRWRDIQLLSILISSISKLVFSGLYLQCCYINICFVLVLNLSGVGEWKLLCNHSSWRCTKSTELAQIKQSVQTPTQQNPAAYIWKPGVGVSFLIAKSGQDTNF